MCYRWRQERCTLKPQQTCSACDRQRNFFSVTLRLTPYRTARSTEPQMSSSTPRRPYSPNPILDERASWGARRGRLGETVEGGLGKDTRELDKVNSIFGSGSARSV